MCLRKHEFRQRDRRLLALASGALFVGLAISNISTAASEHLRPALHAVTGFMVGLSVTLYLALWWRRHRGGSGSGTGSGTGGTQLL
jgi:hypothetical protein